MNPKMKSIVMALALVPAVLAQAQATNTAAPQQDPVYQEIPVPAVPELILRDGTPVRIRLSRTLSSGVVTEGDSIDFETLDDVVTTGKVLIPRGSVAIGVITASEHKKRMARGGKLNFTVQYVRLEDGTKVALRANRETKGGGHVGAMTAGMVATAALGFGVPAAFFLFMHGKDAVVPAGTELTAYVNGDVRLPSGNSLASSH
jgi:hypothetical protein